MFTDMVGYTAISQKNESLAMELLGEQQRILRSFFPKYSGREIKTIGDGFLVEFESALEAIRCAFEIQKSLHELNSNRSAERKIPLRIGIHLGDVIHNQSDVYGDAVNIASRIEPLASPGGICFTEQIYSQIKNKFESPMNSLGMRELKNVSEPIEVFELLLPWEGNELKAHGSDIRRIAILPFASLSPDPNDVFLADGITEEIISTTAGISGLEVISRTSVMGYKGTSKKVKEIGKELDVGSILEGSFRKAGNRIRVTAQLIDVSGDKHLWSQSYDKLLDDVFAVQTDIAKQVAESLRVKILAPELERLERKPTLSSKAYSLYLRGRYHWHKRDVHEMDRAVEYFEEAIREDENFALGYVGLADCFEIIASNLRIEKEKNHQRAKEMLARALELEPDLAEAHATKGLVLSNELRLREAEKELRKAIELKPSYSSAHQWYSLTLASLSRWEEALVQIEKAVELDPFSAVISTNHCGYYLYRRDYGKALEIMKKASELAPTYAFPHLFLARIYVKLKMIEDVKRELELYVRLAEDVNRHAKKIAETELAFAESDVDATRKLLPELEPHVGEPFFYLSVDIARFYFWLGEKEKGFEWLERSYSAREFQLPFAITEEDFDTARQDVRFVSIQERIKNL
jgi:adenylate cyclase